MEWLLGRCVYRGWLLSHVSFVSRIIFGSGFSLLQEDNKRISREGDTFVGGGGGGMGDFQESGRGWAILDYGYIYIYMYMNTSEVR